jgi:hypothetical protein
LTRRRQNGFGGQARLLRKRFLLRPSGYGGQDGAASQPENCNGCGGRAGVKLRGFDAAAALSSIFPFSILLHPYIIRLHKDNTDVKLKGYIN